MAVYIAKSNSVNSPASLKIEIVADIQGFAALQEEWNNLVDRSRNGFVTLTWEWMFTWWEGFNEGRQLHILLARDGTRLVGIAPLQRRRIRNFGLVFQRLEFLASGEDEADEICSDYLDFIIEPDREEEILAAFWRYCQSNASQWAEVHLSSVRADSPTAVFLSTNVSEAVSPRATSVVVPLSDDWEKFLMTLSKKMRFRVRRHRRLLADKGPVLFERLSSAPDIAARFSQFISLHQQWWQSRGKPGCFSSHRFTAFHQTVSQRLAERGLVDLYFLSVAGQAVAARYAFHFKGRLFDYQTGVDPEFDPHIGVGVECTGYCIEDAISRGFNEYDFGEGLQPYKQRWTDQTRETVNIRIVRPSLKATVRNALDSFTGHLRKWKQNRRLRVTAGQSPAETE